MGGLASWEQSPMKEGGLYRYLKVGRDLVCGNLDQAVDYFLFLDTRSPNRDIDEITHNQLVVYLDKHLVKNKLAENARYSFLLIKVLTQNGTVGWVSWNLYDWEEVEVCR